MEWVNIIIQGVLIGGLIIKENIFNYPVMGVYFIDAVSIGDFP